MYTTELLKKIKFEPFGSEATISQVQLLPNNGSRNEHQVFGSKVFL